MIITFRQPGLSFFGTNNTFPKSLRHYKAESFKKLFISIDWPFYHSNFAGNCVHFHSAVKQSAKIY